MPRPCVPPAAATLRDWITYAERRFSSGRLAFGHGTHNARDEAVWLLVHVLGIAFGEVDAAAGRPLDAVQRRRALELIEARVSTRKPLAYLLREAWLRGERFHVDERVIVPRSFLAELLPRGLDSWLPRSGVARVLDLCTGSGCLAVLAAKAFPVARVDAADISRRALAVARRNVAAHRLRRRVRLLESDLFDALPPARYDLVLCNPPYVDRQAMKRLPAEYRHEPQLALSGGRDGLDTVMRIAEAAPGWLAEDGILVMEIGHNRKALERRAPGLALTWLSTSAGDDLVLLATRAALERSADTGASSGIGRAVNRASRRSL